MGRLFGTDGVRGLANRDITADMALGLAVAAARVLGEPETPGTRPFAVVGRDPRASGEFLQAAMMAGLASAGVDVLDVGVLPTPGVAHLTDALGAEMGVMLSASHNPAPDNGIKFFDRGGTKLPDAVEDAIEKEVGRPWVPPTGADVGRIRDFREGGARYVQHLLGSMGATRLEGIKVVVDCANGAASTVAPEAYRRAGAEVIVIAADPDGLNINDGVGSTHLGPLREAVLANGADLGIAHDGDADRCLAIDAAGATIDGDQLLAILAAAMRDAGTLQYDTVVSTVMSNLGFTLAMRREGINAVQTTVGDRYVLEAMRDGGYNLGGEQSGHVVLLDHATTGDGTLTALQVMARMATTGRSLADLASIMERFPQVMINVRGVDKTRVSSNRPVRAAVREAEARLRGRGRVLLRASGTESLVRVMVEASTQAEAQETADTLAAVVKANLAL